MAGSIKWLEDDLLVIDSIKLTKDIYFLKVYWPTGDILFWILENLKTEQKAYVLLEREFVNA